MKIFISTGEVSGDLQGAMLVSALYRQGQSQGIKNLTISGLGGQKMKNAGTTLIADTTAIGSIGLFESVPFILPTWQIQQKAKKYLQAQIPDLVVLIDYVGPNLAIASYLKQKLPQVPIIWYIGPQYWVWTPLEANVQQLVRFTDKLLAIFPAEAEFYQKKGLESTYVGHPLVDRIKTAPMRSEARAKLGIKEEETLITLLPASRKQELKYLLPVMCEAVKELQNKLPSAHFYLPVSLPQYRPQIEKLIQKYHLNINLFEGETLDLLAGADLAITKSGTVNLELALLKVPQVVIYKVNPVTIWFARNILKFAIPFMSPANLVLMKEVVPELLQEKANVDNIVEQSLDLLNNNHRRQQIQAQYVEIENTLANGVDSASERTAMEIIKYLQEQFNS
jgi:lipid-A-disaccharide synthase